MVLYGDRMYVNNIDRDDVKTLSFGNLPAFPIWQCFQSLLHAALIIAKLREVVLSFVSFIRDNFCRLWELCLDNESMEVCFSPQAKA